MQVISPTATPFPALAAFTFATRLAGGLRGPSALLRVVTSVTRIQTSGTLMNLGFVTLAPYPVPTVDARTVLVPRTQKDAAAVASVATLLDVVALLHWLGPHPPSRLVKNRSTLHRSRRRGKLPCAGRSRRTCGTCHRRIAANVLLSTLRL